MMVINPEEGIRYEAFALNSFQSILSNGLVEFFEFSRPTGTRDSFYSGSGPISWSACTFAIRMGSPLLPEVVEVPTMNE